MPDRVLPGPVETGGAAANNSAANGGCADSVNIHTSKIYDACREKQ